MTKPVIYEDAQPGNYDELATPRVANRHSRRDKKGRFKKKRSIMPVVWLIIDLMPAAIMLLIAYHIWSERF